MVVLVSKRERMWCSWSPSAMPLNFSTLDQSDNFKGKKLEVKQRKKKPWVKNIA